MTPEDFLDTLSSLRWSARGERTPHKPLLVLLVLAPATRGVWAAERRLPSRRVGGQGSGHVGGQLAKAGSMDIEDTPLAPVRGHETKQTGHRRLYEAKDFATARAWIPLLALRPEPIGPSTLATTALTNWQHALLGNSIARQDEQPTVRKFE